MTSPAYRADGVAVGREDFYRVACDPARSAVVEACAGAGKTWMLVSRVLRALLDGAQTHEILAITFTRKAAGEMQQRLNEWLRAFSDPGVDRTRLVEELIQRGVSPEAAFELTPVLASLHERVLSAARPVQAQTFHAWFANLMRAAPSELLDELGLQRDMELIEAIDDHRAAIWRRFHGAVMRDAARLDDFETLTARRGRFSLRQWLETALDRRVEIELADRAGVLDGSVSSAHEMWPEIAPGEHPAHALDGPTWLGRLRALAHELGRGGVQAQAAASALVLAIESNRGEALFDSVWAALFTQTGTPRKQLGDSAALTRAQDDLERVAAQIRQHEAHDEHLRMARLARLLLDEYRAYKTERGLADMSDLETCALTLLRDSTLSGWILERLDARYRHVLIDEFQDTSPLQWHALHAWLSGYAGAGGGASGQRMPSIFIVGDPKQSIYRFRRAEPRVFEAARVFVQEALGGVVLECDHTRRNAREIVEPLNAVFGEASASGDFDGYRAHSTEAHALSAAGVWALPMVPREGNEESDTSGEATWTWRDSLTIPRRLPDEERRADEAELVARAIREWVVQEGVRPADIMVLCRKRQSLRLAAQALRDVHVPFVAVEDHDLLDAPEVRDLVDVLDVLASPGHSLSLARALRSPLFGASDDDLVELARRAGDTQDWWEALLENEQSTSALRRARDLLKQWESDARALPPHDLLDRIIHTGQYRERVAAIVPAEQRASALDAIDSLLEQSLTLNGARYATPYNFVRSLKRRSIQVAAREQTDAVRLLTIHGAKGLESPVVFIMDTDPQPTAAQTTSVLVDWPVESPAPIRCAFLYSESKCPESLRAQVQLEAAAREREELNGLYVAMTRARERLVLSATQPGFRATRASWWERLARHATPWSPASAAVKRAERTADLIRLIALPELASPRRPEPAREPDSPTQRLGSAVHRFLEWASARGDLQRADWPTLAHDAALEFSVSEVDVGNIGSAILESSECRRFFMDTTIKWAGNEVPVSDEGQVLRIDRLVQFDAGGAPVWWVLDYKLAGDPAELHANREQLLRYRRAVVRLEPGAAVHCAFITGTGRLMEIH